MNRIGRGAMAASIGIAAAMLMWLPSTCGRAASPPRYSHQQQVAAAGSADSSEGSAPFSASNGDRRIVTGSDSSDGRIAFHARGRNGPVSGAQVLLLPASLRSIHAMKQQDVLGNTDAHGRLELTGVPVGQYEVHIRPPAGYCLLWSNALVDDSSLAVHVPGPDVVLEFDEFVVGILKVDLDEIVTWNAPGGSVGTGVISGIRGLGFFQTEQQVSQDYPGALVLVMPVDPISTKPPQADLRVFTRSRGWLPEVIPLRLEPYSQRRETVVGVAHIPRLETDPTGELVVRMVDRDRGDSAGLGGDDAVFWLMSESNPGSSRWAVCREGRSTRCPAGRWWLVPRSPLLRDIIGGRWVEVKSGQVTECVIPVPRPIPVRFEFSIDGTDMICGRIVLQAVHEKASMGVAAIKPGSVMMLCKGNWTIYSACAGCEQAVTELAVAETTSRVKIDLATSRSGEGPR